jgi:hypothetical protein
VQATQSAHSTPWWIAVNGASWRHPYGPGSDALKGEMQSHPVVHVSWADANAYCAWAYPEGVPEGAEGGIGRGEPDRAGACSEGIPDGGLGRSGIPEEGFREVARGRAGAYLESIPEGGVDRPRIPEGGQGFGGGKLPINTEGGKRFGVSRLPTEAEWERGCGGGSEAQRLPPNTEGVPPLGVGRLPTEAEWELAARGVPPAGKEASRYPWGDALRGKKLG